MIWTAAFWELFFRAGLAFQEKISVVCRSQRESKSQAIVESGKALPASWYLHVRNGALVHDWQLPRNKQVFGSEFPQDHRISEHPQPKHRGSYNIAYPWIFAGWQK